MAASSDQRHGLSVAAVIFDLDGVIVDSEIWWHEERVAWATGLGRSWSAEDSQAVMGANSLAWARIMRERKGLPPEQDAAIEADIVGRVVRRYDAGAPAIVGAPEACLVAEDSINGVKAGLAAGMRVVLVPNASVPPAAGAAALATYVLGRLADLDPGSLPLASVAGGVTGIRAARRSGR